MSNQDEARRIVRLKRRPTLADKSDDFLQLMVEEATDFFLDYTHLRCDPGERVDNLICELAVFRLNQEGVENVQSASEGEVSRSYYDGIPPMLVHRLNGMRIPRGL